MNIPLRVTNKVQPIADPDKLIVTSTLRRDLLKEWINKMVRNIKESSSAYNWAAPVLLSILIGYTVWNGQSTAGELKELNKQVIILQTQKVELEKQNERERQERFQILREQEAWRETMKDDINEIRLVLKIPKRRN